MSGEGMLFTAQQQKRLMQNGLARQVSTDARVNHNAKIHFAITHTVEHQPLSLIAQQDADFRIFLLSTGDTLRHQLGGNGLAGSDTHAAIVLSTETSRVEKHSVQLIE